MYRPRHDDFFVDVVYVGKRFVIGQFISVSIQTKVEEEEKRTSMAGNLSSICTL